MCTNTCQVFEEIGDLSWGDHKMLAGLKAKDEPRNIFK